MRQSTLSIAVDPEVQINGINNPDDKRGRFLRIPAPERTPRAVSPYRSREKRAERKQDIPDNDRTIGNGIELTGIGQSRKKGSSLLEIGFNQI